MTGHQPVRSAWTCDTCGQPWPCPPARGFLRRRYGEDKVGLSTRMADLLFVAAGDVYAAGARGATVHPIALHARFIAWTR
jgi:hypothetical protein